MKLYHLTLLLLLQLFTVNCNNNAKGKDKENNQVQIDTELEKKLTTDQSLSSNFSGTLLGVLLFGLFTKNPWLALKYGTTQATTFHPTDLSPILQSIFNNECGPNSSLISVFNFDQSVNPSRLCYGGYIAILTKNPNYVRFINNGLVGELYLNGFQKSIGRPNGVLRIKGETRHFFNSQGSWFLNPDAEFNITPY